MNVATLPRTGLQEALLERLQGLGVDIAPAHDLRGVELDRWIDQADDDLFEALTVDLPRARFAGYLLLPETSGNAGIPEVPRERIPGEWQSLSDALAAARDACAVHASAVGFTARRLDR